jgi:hypothetical protein
MPPMPSAPAAKSIVPLKLPVASLRSSDWIVPSFGLSSSTVMLRLPVAVSLSPSVTL